jgi:AAHS family 4-hydroxybenzoate transporter-like MFS transporter
MTRVWLVVLSISIIMVDGFDLQSIGFVAPEIARAWSLPISAFGPVFSAALAGSILGAMSAGLAARRFGLQWVLSAALVVFGAGTLASAWAAQLWTLIALRFVVGIGLGAAVPLVMTWVAEFSPVRFRATFVIVALCGQPIGAIFGGALCARLIPAYGWPAAFYLGGILPLLLIVALGAFSRPIAAFDNDQSSALRKDEDGSLLRLFQPNLLRKTVLLWCCSFLSIMYIYIIVNWLPSSMRAVGYSLQASVLAIGLFNFGGIAGALFCGSLMDRYDALKILPVFYGLAALSLAALDESRSHQPMLLACAFFGGFLGYGAVMSLGSLTIMLYPRPLRATGTGWVLGVGRLGAALGPLAAGIALAAGLGIGRLFYFAAGAALLAMASILLLEA